MTEAGRAIQTLQVTEAVRDAKIGGKKVKKGQTIALDPDDGLSPSTATATRRSWPRWRPSSPGFELVTLFYGDGADLAEAEAIARRIGGVVPGIEVEVRPRRPALLPLPDLGRVGGVDGAAHDARGRRPRRRPAAAPTDPVELPGHAARASPG